MRHLTCAFVALMLFPAGASAQTATVTKNAPVYLQQNPPEGPTSPRTERGWFDVDLGLAVSGADEVALEYYGLGTTFDFGGGVMIVPFLGVGVSFTGTAYLTGDDGYDDVSRTEGGVNIQAMIVPLHRENMRVRIFGGPTHGKVSVSDLIGDFVVGGFQTGGGLRLRF